MSYLQHYKYEGCTITSGRKANTKQNKSQIKAWVSLRRVDPLQLCIAHPKQLYAVAPRHNLIMPLLHGTYLISFQLNLLLMIALY